MSKSPHVVLGKQGGQAIEVDLGRPMRSSGGLPGHSRSRLAQPEPREPLQGLESGKRDAEWLSHEKTLQRREWVAEVRAVAKKESCE